MLNENIIDSRSIAIVGAAGTGKTTVLKERFDEIRAKQKVKTISIANDSELVWRVDGVIKNKILREAEYDGSDSNIEMLDVSWQDIELDRNSLSIGLLAMVVEKVIEFVENSDVPCVILVEDMCLFKPQRADGLMRIFDAVVQRGGYFLFTSSHIGETGMDWFLDKAETIIDLGCYDARIRDTGTSEERRNRGMLYNSIRNKVKLGIKVGQGRCTSITSQLCPLNSIKEYPQMDQGQIATFH
jgi:KaiC/GvpD/RAD55 family RecA-like ATPase